jgi:putative DNA primase/helicase
MSDFKKEVLERFRLITATELQALEILPPEPLIEPFLPCGDLAMISADRGVGKTQVSLGLAVAAATGTSFLRWNAPKRRRVLFVDGEMGPHLMKRRHAEAQGRLPPNVAPTEETLTFLTPDMCLDGIMPDLATDEGRAAVDVLVEVTMAELLVLDNISTLFRVGEDESKSASWVGPQQWLVSLKARGVSVLLVHHLGKNGTQRGTSMREDVLGCSIRLKRPQDYEAREGCRFVLEYTKARNLTGEDAQGFEAALIDGRWNVEGKKAATLADVLELKQGGLSTREIAEHVGSSKSSVARLLASAKGASNG